MAGASVAHAGRNSHLQLPDIGRPTPAKANVQKPDIEWIEAISRAVSRAVAISCLTHKEAAAKAQVDESEFGKWLSGNRRPQFDRLFSVRELRQPLLEALAALVPGAEVTTEIRIKKDGAA